MDYIRQINAFENWLEYNELGAGPQLLWYKLMAIANKSGWQSELSIANTRLQSMTKTSEKTLINNRNQLIQTGLLQYKKRGRTKAGLYVLSDITGNFPVKTKVNNFTTGKTTVDSTVNVKVNPTVNSSVDSTVKPSAYINNTIQDKTKDNHDDEKSPLRVANEYWGQNRPLNSVLQDAILRWCNQWPNEMVVYAMELTYHNSVDVKGVKPYVSVILSKWSEKNIDTLEKAKANTKPKKTGHSNKRVEQLPDHIANPPKEIPFDPAKEAELDRKLQEYLSKE
ncbi:DNA replication protein DnaD [Enterococcus gilvus]|uniref:DnaD domain protein n=1 Tax=Enterococcus gilvus TaxID=160453 RepID=UPI000DF606E5|nr:DnaD domain protein [Enterococcus gilvus]AXG38006.1 DNA replication protein DnaD [Enterococcus gilvus]